MISREGKSGEYLTRHCLQKVPTFMPAKGIWGSGYQPVRLIKELEKEDRRLEKLVAEQILDIVYPLLSQYEFNSSTKAGTGRSKLEEMVNVIPSIKDFLR